MPTSARGASHWPFIITLVLFLGCIFLWFDQKSETDAANKTIAELKRDINGDEKAAIVGLRQKLLTVEEWADKVTAVVGFQKDTLLPEHNKQVTKPELVADALNADKDGSVMSLLRKAATITYADAKWKPGKGAPAGQVLVAKLSQAFKDQIKAVNAAWPKEMMPSPPTDEDDAAAVADYKARKQAFDEQFAKYSALLDALVKDPQFQDLPVVIGESPVWDPDKVTPLAWSFWDKPATAFTTLEEFISIPAGILQNMNASYVEVVSSAKKDHDGLAELVKQQKLTIDNADEARPGLQQQLTKEQEAHTADVTRLQKEAEVARAETEKLRVSETGAQQALAAAKETSKKEIDKLVQVNKAQENRIVGDKEKRDLEIQRDEPDGTLLGADAALGTGYISLGNQDKVYPGLKFVVSYIGRGAIRMTKGEVVVTKVLDAHYSQVRILSQVFGEKPMTARDLISNPFFSTGRPIHVYLAGDLRKYPKAVAAARLAKMGVVLEDNINQQTDYVLIPDSMSVKPSGEAAAPPEGGVKAESELERLGKLAHTFGADLITERMIENFLDY